MMTLQYNPDVLDALANLSNDEVFTPPKLVNQMLDCLPSEIWSDKTITILDPASKSWVFLRESAKRFILWLEKEFPDLQERLNHIFTKQLFGISITELTSLLSRRSLYCSKYADGKYSLCTEFDDVEWNIRYERTAHTWENETCKHCGASKSEYDRDESLETHAYKFIHATPKDIENLFVNYQNMKFDVIIWNPPYQLSDGWAQASAMPIYQKFVEQAKKLKPRYLSMITPSRWFAWWRWLDNFRKNMIEDDSIKKIVDFHNASDCFPWVEIKGWVSYFLREKDYHGSCIFQSIDDNTKISCMDRNFKNEWLGIIIRYNEAVPILNKIKLFKWETIEKIASSQRPFWFRTYFKWKKKNFPWSVKIYANNDVWYVNQSEITVNKELVLEHKVIIPRAIWSWNSKTDLIKPLYSEPNTCCSETYIVFWPFKSESESKNFISYVNTSFFHFLVTLQKNTMMAPKWVYSFVPMQDFSQSWSDDKLFKKYKLSKGEIEFIKDMTHPSL
jgi:hypothetical protein